MKTILVNPYLVKQKILPIPQMEENKCVTPPRKTEQLLTFLDKNKPIIVSACMVTGALLMGDTVHANGFETLDERAREVYFGRFIKIAMWLIVGKGGWDTVNKALKEDFEGAKKSIFQYTFIFGALFILPVGLNLIQEFFAGM